MLDQVSRTEIALAAKRATPGPLEVKNHGLYSNEVPVVWAVIDNTGKANLGLMEDDIELLCNARNWVFKLLDQINGLRYELTIQHTYWLLLQISHPQLVSEQLERIDNVLEATKE